MAYKQTFLSLGSSVEDLKKLEDVKEWVNLNLTQSEKFTLDNKLEKLASVKKQGLTKAEEMMKRFTGSSDYCERFSFLPRVYKRGFAFFSEDPKILPKGYNPVQNFEQKPEKRGDYTLKREDTIFNVKTEGSNTVIYISSIFDERLNCKLVYPKFDLLQENTLYTYLLFAGSVAFVECPKTEGAKLLHAISTFEMIDRIYKKENCLYVKHECMVAGELYEHAMFCV